MRLKDWVAKQGPGALSFLMHESRLAYTTVLRAVRGEGVSAKTAEKLSEATRGEVSPGEISHPGIADLARSA